MFGFVFPINFNSPYRSVSITDFWRRWHISLSSFLRDYLYIPLGGNRKGPGRTYVNLILVMLLGGLWHGAAWTFVVWGAWHGAWLAIERLWGKHVGRKILPSYLAIPVVFIIASLGWVWFRADSFATAAEIFRSLFGLAEPDSRELLLGGWVRQPYLILTLVLALGISWFGQPTHRLLRTVGVGKAIWILLIFVLAVIAMANQSFNPFIYFNF
jgi:alginate O-acetyltransferase complex protein AlgI